jgi:hypothetical protein
MVSPRETTAEASGIEAFPVFRVPNARRLQILIDSMPGVRDSMLFAIRHPFR